MITVEDGTGLEDAQAYIDLAYFVAYVDERNLYSSDWTNTQIEAALVMAAKDWIDGQHDFNGEALTETQALSFPRDLWSGVPEDIKKANAQAAHLHLQGLLFVDLSSISSNGQIAAESKSVGDLSKSVTYVGGTGQVYSRVLPKQLKNLLRPYLSNSGGLGMVMRR